MLTIPAIRRWGQGDQPDIQGRAEFHENLVSKYNRKDPIAKIT